MSMKNITEGDFGQAIELTFKDADEATPDFSAYTAVVWIIEKAGGTPETFSPPTFKGGTQNRVSTHTPTDNTFWDTAGSWRIWVQMTDGTRKLTSAVPEEFDVAPKPL